MKDKKFIILIVVIVILFAGVVFSGKDNRIVSWEPNFKNNNTDPYGTYITYNLLNDIFDERARTTRLPIYTNLKDHVQSYFQYDEDEYDYYEDDYEVSTEDEEEPVIENTEMEENNDMHIYDQVELVEDTTSYVFVNTSFILDSLDLKYLLDFVGIGNNVFISAESFDRKLMKKLKLKTTTRPLETDSVYCLTDYPDTQFTIPPFYGGVRFDTDSCLHPVQVLAVDKQNNPVFIRIKYANGSLYLHTVPTAFANVYQLRDNKYQYAYRCLSYLPRTNRVIWDEYQKQGLVGEYSIFRVLLNNDALRTSLYLTLIGLLLFMLFRAKRIQRVIPIIKPPVNSSIEFLDTISNMYYRKKDFGTIIKKRHAHFLDFIRKNFYLSTEHINDEFIDALSAKSGETKQNISQLFFLYDKMAKSQDYITNDRFLKYNALLEDFYKKTKK